MNGSIIKLVFQSLAGGNGLAKLADGTQQSLGNMREMSKAAQILGASLGGVGGAIGKLVGSLIQGSVWGVAIQSVAILAEKFDLTGKKAEEARKKTKELADAARARFDAVNTAAEKAIANISKETAARQAMSDIIERQTKAELGLRRAEALRSGDLAKAQALEAEIADAGRQGAVDKAASQESDAERRVAEAKRALDAAQKNARDAMKREAEAEAAVREAERPREETTYYGNGATLTRTVSRIDKDARANLSNAQKDVVAADDAVDKAMAAYEIELQKWNAAKANSKAVAKEQQEAAEKAAAEEVAAHHKAMAEKKAAEKKANEEWVRQRKEAARKAAEEEWILQQRNHQKQLALMREYEAEMLKAEKDANSKRADDLRAKLKAAQSDAAIAFSQFRDPKQIDQKAERRARRQEEFDRVKLANAAIDLQERNPNWRNARNLSRRDEAARRWLLAKENEKKAGTELKDVVSKLDKIETLLQAATTL